MGSFYIISAWADHEGEEVIGLWDDLTLAKKWVTDHPGTEAMLAMGEGVWRWQRIMRNGTPAGFGYYIREALLNQPLPGMDA